MLVTIWMCTQEWSLISMRATAFTFETCHQPLSCVSSLTRSISVRSLRLPRTGHVDPHPLDRLGGREAGLALGLRGDRLVDPLGGLLVDVTSASIVDRHRRECTSARYVINAACTQSIRSSSSSRTTSGGTG